MLRFLFALALFALASGAAAQSTDSTEVYEMVEQTPELIGGLAALQERIEYPEMARRNGIEGRVFVQFIVDEQGAVQAAECMAIGGVVPNALLCEAGRAAVLASRITPGMQDGQPVKVRFTLPVDFKLQGTDSCLGIF